MELLTKLGIDWKLLIAQAVNFLIVLAVLYRFLYKPLLKFLDERKRRIESSLTEAKRIESELKNLEQKRIESDREARRQAQEIIVAAEKEAEIRRQEVINKMKQEAQAALEEAKQRFESEKEEAMRSLRQDSARLITQALTKVIGKLPSGEVDKKLVSEAVEEVSRRRTKS
ncbi:MAG: ATP synthase subunit b [Parcubacteria group bacterium GW2011_GWD2_43_10]|uniref:ATP synthase subunit b n=4 Tax=Candidatus Vebleniibacteriota TaxID=1817921 RepID=A0A1G2Q7T6_9BACT|nr:MAG: ATP synthase subunit b [Parcubacteria group bacterium GW2011_GWD1_42_9]KKS82242.1 MAG: ATP synthase subunit b [Parcubacteria group bacterium GW2011_GWD2_43_10]KKT12422.1 MAG: ATP synthase subunit b [Parcubacteria group bacterium GW2011_GWA1_43_27]KKT14084.1 MAG: ATP synthase subunit b [Parcubacteria group bacterium GW2011_GWF2_43_38]KKT21582.1 MAG: ATP synthase subunit b [Parcubacteria group bacterium GW2011_GWE1_43_8]KKT27206.1 MAG: ATP synthase subunit b [Parcubacteria group bacteriu